MCCLCIPELFYYKQEILEKVTLPEEMWFVGQWEFIINATRKTSEHNFKEYFLPNVP